MCSLDTSLTWWVFLRRPGWYEVVSPTSLACLRTTEQHYKHLKAQRKRERRETRSPLLCAKRRWSSDIKGAIFFVHSFAGTKGYKKGAAMAALRLQLLALMHKWQTDTADIAQRHVLRAWRSGSSLYVMRNRCTAQAVPSPRVCRPRRQMRCPADADVLLCRPFASPLKRVKLKVNKSCGCKAEAAAEGQKSAQNRLGHVQQAKEVLQRKWASVWCRGPQGFASNYLPWWHLLRNFPWALVGVHTALFLFFFIFLIKTLRLGPSERPHLQNSTQLNESNFLF